MRKILPVILLIALMAADLMVGGIGWAEVDSVIFIKLRLPRMLTAVLAGASLSLAGLQMQSVFRNPLADPHIMGVSAGAGTGAAIATLLVGGASAFSGISIVAAAFLGALAASLLIILIAARIQSATTLLIFGVMLGFVLSAVTSILEYSANAESLKMFYSWSAGSFTGNRPEGVLTMAGTLLVAVAMAVGNSRGLDIALFGNEYAALAGADVPRVRNIAMISSCLVTGAVTAFCGPLGFVGIVAPHIARAVTRSAVHRVVIPATLVVGAGIALTADIISQVSPSPLPVGSTMAVIGIPIILVILMKK